VACSDEGAAPLVTVVIEPPASTELLTGDLLPLVATSSDRGAVLEWSSSAPFVATVDAAGVVEALRPGSVRIEVGGSRVSGDALDLTVVQRPGGYTAAEIDYFGEIAFGAEFGTASPLLRRWPQSRGPRIRINGSPTDADLETLTAVRAEIGALTGLDMAIVDAAQTVDIHFVPVSEFTSVLPQAPPGNVGVVWLWWDGGQHLVQSVVLIGSDIDPVLRAHIIREEVTQMLGLLRDSFRYPQSIFYQAFSTVQEYAPVDRTVIELLYRPELQVGMTLEVAMREARRLLRSGTMAVAPGAGRDDVPPLRQRATGPPGSAGSGSASGAPVPSARLSPPRSGLRPPGAPPAGSR